MAISILLIAFGSEMKAQTIIGKDSTYKVGPYEIKRSELGDLIFFYKGEVNFNFVEVKVKLSGKENYWILQNRVIFDKSELFRIQCSLESYIEIFSKDFISMEVKENQLYVKVQLEKNDYFIIKMLLSNAENAKVKYEDNILSITF